jgi:hypothetical protein
MVVCERMLQEQRSLGFRHRHEVASFRFHGAAV